MKLLVILVKSLPFASSEPAREDSLCRFVHNKCSCNDPLVGSGTVGSQDSEYLEYHIQKA